jgi:hypothetical protein
MTEVDSERDGVRIAIALTAEAYAVIEKTPALQEVAAGTHVIFTIMRAIRNGVKRKTKHGVIYEDN